MLLFRVVFPYATSVEFGDSLFRGTFQGALEFIYDERGSKSTISDKDITPFQLLAEMRRCSHSFSKMH